VHARVRAAERAPARPRLLGRRVDDAIRTGLVLPYGTSAIAMVVARDGRRWIVDLHCREVVTTLPSWRLSERQAVIESFVYYGFAEALERPEHPTRIPDGPTPVAVEPGRLERGGSSCRS
jgi:hypothetical protein